MSPHIINVSTRQLIAEGHIKPRFNVGVVAQGDSQYCSTDAVVTECGFTAGLTGDTLPQAFPMMIYMLYTPLPVRHST